MPKKIIYQCEKCKLKGNEYSGKDNNYICPVCGGKLIEKENEVKKPEPNFCPFCHMIGSSHWATCYFFNKGLTSAQVWETYSKNPNMLSYFQADTERSQS